MAPRRLMKPIVWVRITISVGCYVITLVVTTNLYKCDFLLHYRFTLVSNPLPGVPPYNGFHTNHRTFYPCANPKLSMGRTSMYRNENYEGQAIRG